MSNVVVHEVISHEDFYVAGNGVVIHLPGLFDEAAKNLQKGKGKVSF